MNLLSIDLGSYSVKALCLKQDGKFFTLLKSYEIIIDKKRSAYPADSTPDFIQAEIVKDLFKKHPNAKVIMQLPYRYTLSRFLSLPSLQRKKVNMMIPFQLDENLPFPTSQAHYTTYLTKKSQSTSALINITNHDEFDHFYSHYNNRDALPAVLTSELSLIQHYIKHRQLQMPALIVDIGHETTKGYFIYKGEVVSNHTNHTAGKTLTNIIAQTYQINGEEAIQYKHKNCFFLDSSQYHEVDEDQREFAKLMKQTFSPLILDIKRWNLGFRIKQGIPIEHVYLTGGSAPIKNFKHFLSQNLSVPVTNFKIAPDIRDPHQILKKNHSSYFLNQITLDLQSSKEKISNFLFGPYSGAQYNTLPMYSASFIGARVLLFSLIFSFLLLFKGIIFESKKNKIYRQVAKTIRLKKYGIPKNRRAYLRKRPERILKLLQAKNKKITQKISAVKTAKQTDALTPLTLLSREIQLPQGTKMKHFTSDGKLVRAEFSGEDKEKLEELEKKIKSSTLPKPDINLSQKELSITLALE